MKKRLQSIYKRIFPKQWEESRKKFTIIDTCSMGVSVTNKEEGIILDEFYHEFYGFSHPMRAYSYNIIENGKVVDHGIIPADLIKNGVWYRS